MSKEPVAGRMDQFYLYWIAVNWRAMAAANGVAYGILVPDVTFQQNRLLKIIAQSVYALDPTLSVQPSFNGTDNYYLYSIASNLNVLCPTYVVGPGRPDQVYAYIIAASLYQFAIASGILPLYAAPNQGDTFNRLLLKIDSLTYEISVSTAKSTCIPGGTVTPFGAFNFGFSSGFLI